MCVSRALCVCVCVCVWLNYAIGQKRHTVRLRSEYYYLTNKVERSHALTNFSSFRLIPKCIALIHENTNDDRLNFS